MEVTEYDQIPQKDMPIEAYTARCAFNSINNMDHRAYFIQGSYRKVIIKSKAINQYVGMGFLTDGNPHFNNLYLYHGNNPNKVFTTEEEAIAWSNKDLGYIN